MSRLFTSAVSLLLGAATALAQTTGPDAEPDPEPLQTEIPGVDAEPVFDADFAFDDDLFNAFEETATESWLDDFTVRISQQLLGQINKHSVALTPDFVLAREREVETNRLGINVRYQNPFAPGWLLQASGQARYYWSGDYEYEANGDNVDAEYRVNEFFVQRSFDRHSIKLGRQTVVWGETVGNSVLDVINHTEFRDFTIIDIEDARLNQWMLVWDFFGEGSNWSTFLNLYPEFNPAPVRGSPFFFEAPFNLTDYRRGGEVLMEAGTQWRRSFALSDISFMAAYLYENQLRYDEPGPGRDDAQPRHNDFLLLGFSANRAFGRLLLNFDLAFSRGVLADGSGFPGSGTAAMPLDLKKDRIGTSFGFEYAPDNEQSISLGVQVQKVLDEREGLLPGQELQNEGAVGSWLVRYSNNLLNNDLVLSATLQGDLKGDAVLALGGIDYTLNNDWSVSTQLIAIVAQQESPLILFDEDLRLGATISYSF